MDRSRREVIDACIYIDEKEHTYRVQLDGKKTLIGNTQGCDVLIKDTKAGQFVGEFIATRRGFEFRSRGDQPITINGHSARGNQRLHHGDVLALDSTRIRYFEVPEVSEVTLQFGIAGVHSGHAFFLTNQSFVRIGQTVGELRIPDSTLDDPQVVIENLGFGATYIRQLGSETETIVDGNKLTERTAIKDGSVIQLGETLIVVREITDIPLPAPSEVLLTSPGQSRENPSDDQKRTSPKKVKTVRKARIRAGGDVVKTQTETEPSAAIHDQATVNLDRAVPADALGALRKARKEGLERSRQARGASAPTPQPYTIRSEEFKNARRQKEPRDSDKPYYLQTNDTKGLKEPSSSTEKPYYLKEGEAGSEEAGASKKSPRPSRKPADKPYYMPKPGTDHQTAEKNSPLDWMEGRPPETDDEQAGATVVLSRDVVENAVASQKHYYVPSGEAPKERPVAKKPKDKKPDRPGVTLQDTSLDELD